MSMMMVVISLRGHIETFLRCSGFVLANRDDDDHDRDHNDHDDDDDKNHKTTLSPPSTTTITPESR